MDRLLARRVPDARELLLRAAAELAAPRLEVAEAGEDGAPSPARAPRPRASAGGRRRRIALQLVEQLAIAGIAGLRVEPQPPPQHRPEAGRHLRARGRIAQLAPRSASSDLPQALAGERLLAVERLVERDAEAELIAAGVRRARPGAAPAPCRPACPATTPHSVSGDRRSPPPGSGGCRRRLLAAASAHRPRPARSPPPGPGRRRPSSTLSGLKSRWTSPAACAAASPRPAGEEDRPRSRARSAAPPPATAAASAPRRTPWPRRPGRRTCRRRRPRPRWDGTAGRSPAPRAAAAARSASAAAPPVRPQQLERHLAVELRIVRRVDHAHAAGADAVQDHVAADRRAGRERRPRLLGRRGPRGNVSVGSVAWSSSNSQMDRSRSYRIARGGLTAALQSHTLPTGYRTWE